MFDLITLGGLTLIVTSFRLQGIMRILFAITGLVLMIIPQTSVQFVLTIINKNVPFPDTVARETFEFTNYPIQRVIYGKSDISKSGDPVQLFNIMKNGMIYNPSVQSLDNGLFVISHRLTNFSALKPRWSIFEKNVSGILLQVIKDPSLRPVSSQIIVVDTAALSKNPPKINDLRLQYYNGIEDTRIIKNDESLYLIGNYYDYNESTNAMIVLKFPLKEFPNMITGPEVIPLTHTPGVREKNWIPFIHNNKVLFVYSIEPHIILTWDEKTGRCKEVCRSSNSRVPDSLRGSSQARIVGDRYWAFVHKKVKLYRYDTYMYAFETTYPFRIKEVTRPFVIEPKSKWNRDVQFVSGFDVVNDECIITYGRQDERSKYFIMKVPELRAMLQPV